MTEKKVFNACQHDCPDNCAMVSTIVDDKVVSVRGRKEHTFTGVSYVERLKTMTSASIQKPNFTQCDVSAKRIRKI